MNDLLSKVSSNWKSGLTVAMINIPLSISLAVASGATPLQGIITGIWAGIIASIFASSHYNIFWVAWALSSILMWFVLANGENGVFLLPLVAIFSGIFMLIIYFLKITKYITLLPSTALHGFLISVWITIALGQISGALGLNDPSLHIPQHKEIIENLIEIFHHYTSINFISLGTFAVWLTFLVVCKKYFPKFPSVITLTILGIGLGLAVNHGYFPKILLLVDKFPTLEFALFDFAFQHVSIHSLGDFISLSKGLISISLVITIIAIIETIISAKIAEKITKVKFNKDKEVLGLALANIGTWVLGWLPNTAVFIRTALNINNGGNHKMSGFLTAIFTLLISALLFNGAFKYLPFPIVSAILMNIALGLIDIALLKKLFQVEKQAFFITLVTTFFSVFWEPTYGILIGTCITLIIYIKKITLQDANISVFQGKDFAKKISLGKYIHIQEENDLVLVKFSGGLNYLNIENNISKIEQLNKKQTLILSLSHLWDIDIDGIEAIDEMIDVLLQNKISVYISWIVDEKASFIHHLHNYQKLSQENKIFPSTSQCLDTLLQK